jgi:hypothetical protein
LTRCLKTNIYTLPAKLIEIKLGGMAGGLCWMERITLLTSVHYRAFLERKHWVQIAFQNGSSCVLGSIYNLLIWNAVYEIRARLKWVKLYQETRNKGLVCRRCRIFRPTLRRWLQRFGESALEGLRDKSRRPKKSPNKKLLIQNSGLVL